MIEKTDNESAKKSIKDIAWNVSEEVYRADNALSYSTLARFNREGFSKLSTLFDKIESPSLTFGSAVDTIITDGMDAFKAKFMVANFDASDQICQYAKLVFDFFYPQDKDEYKTLNNVPDDKLADFLTDNGYQLNWKKETRARVFKEKASDYYRSLADANGRTVIDSNTYTDVTRCCDVLKTSVATKFYFNNDAFDTNIEKVYQLKFKATFNDIDYRCMPDLLIVNHENKTILPIDLKTSSHEEWDFPKSFVQWNYQIQARLYWRIIERNIKNDAYFKDFTLLDYLFIVVNRKTITPLVWNFDDTKTYGSIRMRRSDDSVISLEDPFDIGAELHEYLTHSHNVPISIRLNEPNSIVEFINKTC